MEEEWWLQFKNEWCIVDGTFYFQSSIHIIPNYISFSEGEICIDHKWGICKNQNCRQKHGDKCPCCKKNALHPFSKKQRDNHLLACEAKLKCGICKEVVMKKKNRELAKFRMLPNCQHCFCLTCISNIEKREKKMSLVLC